MKVEFFGKDCLKIFINCNFNNSICYKNKDEVISFVRSIILNKKNVLKMCGFYKVKIYNLDKVGLFIEVIKLDDLDINSLVELRIVYYQDEVFYYETDNYDVIENCNDKRYIDGKFYCIVDDYFDELLTKVEFGRFIYGKDLTKVLNNSIFL